MWVYLYTGCEDLGSDRKCLCIICSDIHNMLKTILSQGAFSCGGPVSHPIPLFNHKVLNMTLYHVCDFIYDRVLLNCFIHKIPE